jgi:hypothetical protein
MTSPLSEPGSPTEPLPKKSEKPTKLAEVAKKIIRPIKTAKKAPAPHPPSKNDHYITLLPEILQPFVSKALDVDLDGLCDF